jgi:hypothetical protein
MKVERQVKVFVKNLALFYLCPQQTVSADIIPHSVVGLFSPKTEGTKTKEARVLISCYQANCETKKFQVPTNLLFTFCYTAETESEVAEKSNWDHANREEKLGLVWRNRKKISQFSMTTFTYRSSYYFFMVASIENFNKEDPHFTGSVMFV